MKRADFEAMVRRLERYAAAKPAAYRRRVQALALLGYAYVFVVLATLVGLLVWLLSSPHVRGYIAAKLILVVGALIVLVLRALWVKLEPPAGRELRREEAPGLFALVDEVVKRTGAPQPAAILLTDDFNAAIVQHARFGFLGGYVNYLIVGMPMLQGTSPDEFEAVLAHECGHLAGGHGRSGAWIYRMRAGWQRLADALEMEAHWGRVLFLRFFRWYAPQFAAYSFVAAREQEYEADSMSARVTSNTLAARALLRTTLAARQIEDRYWPKLFARIADAEAPPERAYSDLGRSLKGRYVATDREQWIREALAEPTGHTDTHPSLADRLRALGVVASPPPPLVETAAERLLGPGYAALVAELDTAWHQQTRESWQSERDARTRGAARRESLVEKMRTGVALGRDERFELARLEELVGDGGRARIGYETLLREYPDDADIAFTVGRLRLSAGNGSGVALLQAAMAKDRQWTPAVTELLAPWFRKQGETAALHELLDAFDDYAAGARRDAIDGSRVAPGDKFAAATLPAECATAVVERLAAHPQVRRAWSVQKLRPDGTPLTRLVVVERGVPWWKFDSQGAETTAAELAAVLEEYGLPVFVPTSEHRWLVKQVRKLDGALVYERRSR